MIKDMLVHYDLPIDVNLIKALKDYIRQYGDIEEFKKKNFELKNF